jgi:hypothetical protein
MALVNTKSAAITNADASPPVANNGSVDGAFVRCKVGTCVTTLADDIDSVYRFVRVPSNARIKKVSFGSGATGATGIVHVGLFQTAANGGAVVDADLFASLLDPGAAAIVFGDITHESGQYTFAESLMPLWQVIGLSSDPGREYDIAAQATEAVADAAIVMKLEVEYQI